MKIWVKNGEKFRNDHLEKEIDLVFQTNRS